MSAVVRRWIRSFCRTCAGRTVFELRPDWSSVCTQCGVEEHRPAASGLLAAV